MALGLLENHRWIFISVSTVTIVGLLVFIFGGFSEKKLYTVPISLIISGGIGNMIDRLSLGYVIDFIDFRLIDFYVFNGADSFVCIGAAILVIVLLRDVILESKKEKTGKSE
jgi:signal peptidase II